MSSINVCDKEVKALPRLISRADPLKYTISRPILLGRLEK
jgi:hypothetical protein